MRTRRPRPNEIADDQGLLGTLRPPARAGATTSDAGLSPPALDPAHPSLAFKRVHATEPIYSVRVSRGYRALGLRERDLVTWFWIGSHADYERTLRQS